MMRLTVLLPIITTVFYALFVDGFHVMQPSTYRPHSLSSRLSRRSTTPDTTASARRKGRRSIVSLQQASKPSEENSSNSFGYEGIPEDQRPATEYFNMRQQPLFNWASEETGTNGLIARLGLTYVALFALVCYPIAGATFILPDYEIQKLTAANVGDLAFLLVLLVRLYSGWGYIGARLQSKVVEFEETGWYDGDFEYKTKEETARDLFLYRSEVQPVEQRIKLVTLVTGALLVLGCVGFNASLKAKPMFNEYDPELLKVLQADDKLAGVAQKQAQLSGRPTYCESRYYRAVANGGQGCN
uniref:DUF1230-domain-containing protein n=1 Tax=Leptocylindrus danicus TaxID=163516 RepID=A0A7S2NRE5_9STRA|mmetsp:Transcript_11018/g.16654  ORF Transcript_11018/g.16654 Transcript_11018/m.16654 type:complete len:300 (+) Transcript_11018:131-1030(+)|eukprot:CAMPEP_0116006412 /NCGR_PEP_ID=MMETSP0321-20121206/1714_1 /TAXON_ID=163516 /ORGANISM="Leptocylindrus danicus var. danicus, Strain B650" /LENGTH=299 /DNA_ID=CAMNT_0003474963 /DNA_START=39 /DNA_END=938 /DNA_ORIENTATION=-